MRHWGSFSTDQHANLRRLFRSTVVNFLQLREYACFIMAQPTDSEFVTIVSDDGFEFIIPRSTAYVSETLRIPLSSSTWTRDLLLYGLY